MYQMRLQITLQSRNARACERTILKILIRMNLLLRNIQLIMDALKKTDFTNNYEVSVLEICSPKVLEFKEVKEHKLIHTLDSLQLSRINIQYPFSIPILHKS